MCFNVVMMYFAVANNIIISFWRVEVHRNKSEDVNSPEWNVRVAM